MEAWQAGVSITVDEMRWPSGDGDAPSMAPGQRQEMESAQQPHGKLGKEGTQCECQHGTGVMKEENGGAYSGGFFFFFFT